MATYFPYFSVPRCGQVNGDDKALKDALENLNTRKSTLRRIPTGILSKNSKKWRTKSYAINFPVRGVLDRIAK